DGILVGDFQWSPDGTKVAFQRTDAATFRSHLLVVPSAGGATVDLASTFAAEEGVDTFSETFASAPAFRWSPDSARLAFLRTTIDATSGNPLADLLVESAAGGTPGGLG